MRAFIQIALEKTWEGDPLAGRALAYHIGYKAITLPELKAIQAAIAAKLAEDETPENRRQRLDAQWIQGIILLYTAGPDGSGSQAVEAMACFQDGARHNHAPSLTSLGNAYYRRTATEGIERDVSKGRGYYKRVLDDRSLPLVEQIFALYGEGCILWNGEEGIPRDPTAAIKAFEPGAEQGYTASLCTLGKIYYDGADVAPDKPKGIRYLEQAVAQNSAEAAAFLGQIYSEGPEADIPKAIRYYNLAGSLGFVPTTQSNIGRLIAFLRKHGGSSAYIAVLLQCYKALPPVESSSFYVPFDFSYLVHTGDATLVVAHQFIRFLVGTEKNKAMALAVLKNTTFGRICANEVIALLFDLRIVYDEEPLCLHIVTLSQAEMIVEFILLYIPEADLLTDTRIAYKLRELKGWFDREVAREPVVVARGSRLFAAARSGGAGGGGGAGGSGRQAFDEEAPPLFAAARSGGTGGGGGGGAEGSGRQARDEEPPPLLDFGF